MSCCLPSTTPSGIKTLLSELPEPSKIAKVALSMSTHEYKEHGAVSVDYKPIDLDDPHPEHSDNNDNDWSCFSDDS